MKAFKTFSITDSPSTSTEAVQEEDCPEESYTDEEEATFEDVHNTLILDPDNMDDLTQVQYDLPAHEKMCSSHNESSSKLRYKQIIIIFTFIKNSL